MLKKIILAAFGILTLFFIFVFIAYQFQELPITDKLYVHPGSCSQIKWKNCLDTKNYQYKTTLMQFDKQSKLKSINEWLNNLNKIRTPFQITLNQNNEYIAQSTEQMTPMTKLCSFQLNDMFHRDALGPKYFTKSYSDEKLKKDIQSFLKLVYSQQMSKLMLVFLYHIYNYEYSKYRPWIETFPDNIHSLVSELTYYEMQLLRNDQSFGFIEKYIEVVKREFKILEQEINKKLTKEEIASFFNNKPLTMADYLYARNIVQITGQGSDSNVHEILLNPCNLYIGRKVLDSEIPIETQQQNFDSDEQAQFDKLADREFQPGDQIVENFHYPYAYSSFVLHGEVPKGSKTDCIELQFYDYTELAKKNPPKNTLLNFIAQNGFACIGNNEVGINRVSFTGKIMNMQDKEIKQCYKEFMQAQQRVDQQFFYFFGNYVFDRFYTLKEVCSNPKWEKFDPRIIPLSSIQENLKKIEQQISQAYDYYQLRKLKKKPYVNAQLIYEYFNEKKNIILGLKEKISSLQPFKIQQKNEKQNQKKDENLKKTEL